MATVMRTLDDTPWLLEDAHPLDLATKVRLEHDLGPAGRRGLRILDAPQLAVSLDRLVIHDNRKWFGEADIRLDAFVVHGHGAEHDPESFYTPQTFRFSRVRDDDELPMGESGLLLFYGRPLYFLDFFLTVSRDRKDTDDLSAILSGQLGDDRVADAIGQLAGLVVAPDVVAVLAALGAAARLGEFVYQILRGLTGATVGLFHTSWLEHRDRFGIGRHPESGAYRVKDLSFSYQIVAEESEPR
jgi:hypothetical protein